jgi:diketogulonate reductase-like aldo/keto reductase
MPAQQFSTQQSSQLSSHQWLTTAAGVSMPGIIYGTAWKKERTAELVVNAIQTGFRGIDTAGQPKHYAEVLVGEGLQMLNRQGIEREALYLQTKFTPVSSQDPEQMPYDKSAPLKIQVAQSFAQSQKNLQTDYVDGLILHSPLASHAQTMEAWTAMEAIHQAGGARQLGISNCYDLSVMQALYADARVKPALVQNRFYKETGYEVDMRRWCASHGVIFQSFWSLTANEHILTSATLRDLAEQYYKNPAQIFFRYLTQTGVVPLTGTSSVQHMRDDLDIFEFTLTTNDLNAVGLLLKEIPASL